jgi:DNA-binding response OmpR family regulator
VTGVDQPVRPPDGGVRRVLLVEDEPSIRTILRTNLEHEGFSVLEAENAVDGIHLLEAHRPDVVVLDLMLPVKDGWWFLREVQQGPLQPPVVMILSARSGDAERLMAQTLGASVYMVKPFDPEKVVKRIRTLIGPRDERAALG